ncbi:MAG: thioredoxin domain-containing protein [Clostridia bacterium]|nr:thioredoxin domain-containing protein [Clostridia bacterium]
MRKEKLLKLSILIVIVISIITIFIYKNTNKAEPLGNDQKSVEKYSTDEKVPTLLDFGATNCEACQIMNIELAKIKTKYEGKVNVKIINVYSDFTNTRKYNVRTIPTQIFINAEGKVIYRHEGIMYESDIVDKLTEMGVN